jgi:hypothetical protein
MVAMAVTVVTVGIRTLPACWAAMVVMAVRARGRPGVSPETVVTVATVEPVTMGRQGR